MKKVIGIDIGGTKINASLVDEEGNIIDKKEVPTEADKGRDAVLNNIKDVIYALDYKEAEAIGIGTPGFIDSENGIVTFAGNIKGWTGLNLKEAVESFVDLPVFVENDANIALVAEKWIGAAKDYDNIVMITLGTGLGGAVYSDGQMLRGSNFQGAELGHLILYPGGRHCTCGQNGCAEAYCAGSALGREYEEITGKKLSGKEVFALVDTDDTAKEVLAHYESNLGHYLTSLRNIFDPQVIVVGGGVIASKDIFWDGMIEKFKEYCNKPETVDIIPAKFLNNAGVIGAAKVAFERINNGK